MGAWNAIDAKVLMPLLAPGEKLSEVEFHKLLAAHQWDAIGALLGVPPQDITGEQGDRLYASVINVELDFGPDHSPNRFSEGASLFIRNRASTYAQRFVEGLFVFDDREIADDELDGIDSRDTLRAAGRPYAYYTNAFIARSGGNSLLRVFKPRGMDRVENPLAETPAGIRDHASVQSTGQVTGMEDESMALTPVDSSPIHYQLIPENDLNGAGLLYFARYVAVTAYAERIFAEERLRPPLSNPLVEALSTERRQIYFFANASPKDVVEVSVQAAVIPPEAIPAPTTARPYRTPLKMVFRMDLRRASDKVLMATSVVRKALNVPASAKGVLAEADRFLAGLRAGGT